MIETTANEFRKKLKEKVDTSIKNHEVLKVKRRNGGDFIVIGERDWRAIEETLYLNRIPDFVQSIHNAANEPLEEGTPLSKIDW